MTLHGSAKERQLQDADNTDATPCTRMQVPMPDTPSRQSILQKKLQQLHRDLQLRQVELMSAGDDFQSCSSGSSADDTGEPVLLEVPPEWLAGPAKKTKFVANHSATNDLVIKLHESCKKSRVRASCVFVAQRLAMPTTEHLTQP